MAFAAIALVIPFAGAGAADKSGRTQVNAASVMANAAVVQDSDRRIKYRGAWAKATDLRYSGGSVRSTAAADARATLTFTGTEVSWIGPVGPTRGEAQVFIDGKLDARVDSWASSFRPSQVLFKRAFATSGTHWIAIVANGTNNHSIVSLDAFLIGPTAPAVVPIPTAPGVVPVPTAPAAVPVPTAPTAVPVPTAPAAVPVPTAPTAVPTAAPTAAPTAKPAPDPTPKPDPTPVPPPTAGRPFAAPVTNATYTVPNTIDDTGSTDVSAALNNWIDKTVPNGSIVSFPAGTYLLNEGIKLGNRSNLVFLGNGATLRLAGSPSNHRSSAFVIGWSYSLGYFTGGSAHIAIKDFAIVGTDPTPGTFGGGENQQAIRCNGSTFIEASDVTVRAVYGDGAFLDNCDDVWIHHTHVVTAGRNGLTVIQGERVLAEDNDYDKVGYVTFDDEPNLASEASNHITFRDNTAGTWGLDFVSIDGAHRGASIKNITITGNVTTGKALSCNIDNGGAVSMSNIVFSDNRSSVSAGGPRLFFAHIDGLFITGNDQPLTSGQLAKISDSTGVVYP